MEKKRKILVVDDTALGRRFLVDRLGAAGYDIEAVPGGQECLDRLKSKGIELVLLDLEMPGLSGIETLEIVRKTFSSEKLPVIIVTSHMDSHVVVQGLEEGANDYVVKPVNVPVLIARIQNCLKTKDAVELKNRFIGTAAHDLRNPIGIVRSTLDLMLEGDLGEVNELQSEFLTRVVRACESMLVLINDLLEVSTVESGSLTLQVRETDAAKFIKDCFESYGYLGHSKKIAMSLEIDQDLPRVDMDSNRIGQVIANLITNAIKFSFPDTAIRLVANSTGDAINISVIDQGQGIPEQDIPKLFSHFSKSSVKPTGGEQSTGLGLAIVRTICRAHGGDVSVVSQVGKGSTFTVRLPLKQKRSESGSHNACSA